MAAGLAAGKFKAGGVRQHEKTKVAPEKRAMRGYREFGDEKVRAVVAFGIACAQLSSRPSLPPFY